MSLITGIHHVTAVSGDVQENIDFYTGVLGLRLVKKTVNFDDPEVYHFYFGDEAGTPGTIMTTFPYGKGLAQGRQGKGKVNTTAFSLPFASLDYWLDRLEQFDVAHKRPQERFRGEAFVYLEDADGLGLELTFNDKEARKGYASGGDIPAEHAIRGIHHVELWLDSFVKNGALLKTVMDHRLIHEGSNRFRYAVEDEPGRYIDILCAPETLRGLSGSGMVHHVAFATPDAGTQREVMEKLRAFGLRTTEVRDRKYFTSIYFNEPGGVIFEIATSGPGFSIDEERASLGERLMLPAQFEEKRALLDNVLPPFIYPSPITL